ncbi:MAG: FHA domain-containing protein, partial [Rivularia sp. (in: cyanobacteria)]
MITLTLLEAQSKTPLENWRFDESTAIRVGRAADNDIVLDNNLVSRYHLELRNTKSKRKVDSWEIV